MRKLIIFIAIISCQAAFGQRVLEWSIGTPVVSCGTDPATDPSTICYPLQVSIADASSAPTLGNVTMSFWFDNNYLSNLTSSNVNSAYFVSNLQEAPNTTLGGLFGFSTGASSNGLCNILQSSTANLLSLSTTPVTLVEFCFEVTAAGEAEGLSNGSLCTPIVFNLDHTTAAGNTNDEPYLGNLVVGTYYLNNNTGFPLAADDEVQYYGWTPDPTFDGTLDAFTDTLGEANSTNCTNFPCAADNDGDLVLDATDIDDDNDGILDAVEDANTDLDNDPATNPTDTDLDGIPDYLDLDSDNDGIPDNVEAMTTIGYIPPTGVVGTNGYYDVYETAPDNGTPIAALATLANTDGTDNPDYLDTDSDNDGTLDVDENYAPLIASSITNIGTNGLDDNAETAATDQGYTDVNGIAHNGTSFTNLFDADGDALTGGDFEYREDCAANPVACVTCDQFAVRDRFSLNCKEYTVVNRAMLDSMVTNGGDFSAVCVSKVTNMAYLFGWQIGFNQDISTWGWDVSNVTNMEGMFINAQAYNQPFGPCWDVSSVTNMSKMFSGAFAFNQDISSWQVGNVTNMSEMFFLAKAFNQNIGSWNVSSVTNMKATFASMSFNQAIGGTTGWDVSSVTNMDSMFYGNPAFNQNLNDWNVSSVSNMGAMFQYANAFNGDISGWTTTSLTDMNAMFFGARAFNQNISGWDVDQVTNMQSTFQGALAFNQNIGTWNVGNVSNMQAMFAYTPIFNQDIGGWDVSSVTNMSRMFNRALVFNQDIGGWDVSSVTNMDGMFWVAADFLQNLSSWCVTQIATEPANFAANSLLDPSTLMKPIWGTCPPVCLPNTLGAGFNATGCLECANYNVGDRFELNGDCYTVVDRAMLDAMVANGGDFSKVCVSKVTDMSGLFDRQVAFNQNISTWDVSNVTNMSTMFRWVRSFNQDISNWDVSSVSNMSAMFQNAWGFNQDISAWDVSSLNSAAIMFQNAFAFNQDISGWNVSNVSSMMHMFKNATSFNQDISTWDVANVSNMTRMFEGATVFNQDLSPWCVGLIPSLPINFATASPLATLTVQHPIWGQVPQMSVLGGSPLTDITAGSAAVSLANGTDLGTASSAVETFTLENNGTRDLVLEAGAITLTGIHAADFTVGGITLPATIAAGTSSTFTVSYSALGTGLRTATVNIASNDCENSVYDFAVEATAPTVPGSANTGNGTSTLPAALEWYAYNQNDAIYLRLPATTDVQHKVEIYSTNGQRVASFSTDEDEVQILQDAPKGVYLIHIAGETQRVVK